MRKKKNIFIILLFLICVFSLLFKITFIHGNSMAPTLRSGQVTLTIKFVKTYQMNDIITFNTDKYGVCVKRIIAVPGDDVLLEDGYIYVNNVQIWPYVYEGKTSRKYTLTKSQYFVIGDNYNNSIDSRTYGPINLEDIIGKIVFY